MASIPQLEREINAPGAISGNARGQSDSSKYSALQHGAPMLYPHARMRTCSVADVATRCVDWLTAGHNSSWARIGSSGRRQV